MPPTKCKEILYYERALKAYVDAIVGKKVVLHAAFNRPSSESLDDYKTISKAEKVARKEYRKATKKFRSLMKNE